MATSRHAEGSPADPVEVGLAEALRRTMATVATPRSIDGAGCLLLDADCTLRFVAASGTSAEALVVAEELCAEGPCHEAFAGGQVTDADLQAEPRWGRLGTLLSASPIRRVIGVPIMLRGLSIGALNAYSARPRSWHATDLEGLHRAAEAVARQLESALDARLDAEGDALTRQLRAACENEPRLRAAADVMMANTGIDRGTAMLRLRQVAAASDQATLEVADQVVMRGRLPSLPDLVARASAIRRTRREMARLALTDPLTGLTNRALFLDRLEQAVARAERTGHHPAVLFIDLDRFKTVNDSLGHEAGDEVLRTVAVRLEAAVRGQDTVARLGGDEFAVLCDAPTRPEIAGRLAERIGEEIARPITVTALVPGSPYGQEHEVSVRASLGVAIVDGERRLPRATELLRDADMAMYDAKASGGGRVRVFTDDIRAIGHRRMLLELVLRTRLDRHARAWPGVGRTPEGLRLVYQPIIELSTGRIVSMEALVRAQHPELGAIGARELIDVAENGGLIAALGSALLDEACHAAVTWQHVPGGEEVQLAFNVSPLQLHDVGFVSGVARTLGASGLAPDRLCLELTESRLLAAPGTAIDALYDLRDLGVRLTIDDFGTGYSSLSYLSRLPVTLLKMDQAFVADMAGGGHGLQVARAVVSLGRSLGLRTVAAGIETPEQARQMAGIDCDYGQGFLFNRPVEQVDLPALLRAGALGPVEDTVGDPTPGT